MDNNENRAGFFLSSFIDHFDKTTKNIDKKDNPWHADRRIP